MKRILIAGIGNIFLGDDAFGCEVASELSRRELPAEVRVIDFGIRGYDLAFAITEGYDTVILVDAMPRGEAPGTVYLVEPDLEEIEQLAPATPDPHSLNPVSVLQLTRSLGVFHGRLLLVGCEPASLGGDDGEMGLSTAVRGAVPQAVARIESLLRDLMDLTTTTKDAGAVPA
jgi:hydrogenase maturation protease